MANANTAAADFIRYLEHNRGLSEHTVQAYSRDVMTFLEFSGITQTTELAERGLTQARAWLASYLEAGAASASLARRTAALHSFSRWLSEHEMCIDFAARLRAPQVAQRLPQVETIAALTRMLEVVEISAEQGDLIAQRDSAVLELMYATGARVSELAQLHLAQLDQSAQLARLFGKGRKERVVPYGQATQVSLERYFRGARREFATSASADWVFLNSRGTKLSDRSIRQVVHRWSQAAGIMELTPHAIRHCAATHMLAGGADLRIVQELLGHSSLKTTQRYTHVDTRRMMKAFQQAHPRA